MIDSLNISYRIIRVFFIILGLLPRKCASFLAKFIGRLWYAVDKKHREIALNNLACAFNGEKSPREIEKTARRTFKNLGMVLFEIAWAMRLEPAEFHRYFRVAGLVNVKRALKKRKGVLYLTSHSGNWELLSVAGYMAGLPVSIVYRPLDFEPLNRFFTEFRTRLGATIIPKSKAARKIFRALRRNETAAVLLDQSADWYDGVYVDFFNRVTCTNKGLALMALKSGAPVVPAFLAREGAGFYVEFGPALPLIKTGDLTKDLEANTQQYNRHIEAFIRRYPDQWFWVHNRWKKKPYCKWPQGSESQT